MQEKQKEEYTGELCENCGIGVYEDSQESYFVVVNNNGEYVRGFGNAIVSIQRTRTVGRCPICGHKFGQTIIEL